MSTNLQHASHIWHDPEVEPILDLLGRSERDAITRAVASKLDELSCHDVTTGTLLRQVIRRIPETNIRARVAMLHLIEELGEALLRRKA